MSFTNQVLQEEVRANLANRDDLTVAAGSRLERFLNFAQDRVARHHRFREFRQLSTDSTIFNNDLNDKYLATPTNLRTLYTIRLLDGTNSHKLTFIDIKRWDLLLPKPSETARRRPTQYTFFRRTFEFHPLPDAVYSLEMRWDAWPTALTTLAQVTEFEHKDDMLIQLATSYAQGSLGMVEKAAATFDIYKAMLNQALLSDEEHPHEDLVPTFEIGKPIGDYWADPFVRSSNL